MKFLILAAACFTVTFGCKEKITGLFNCLSEGVCDAFAPKPDECKKCIGTLKEGSSDGCGVPEEFLPCLKLKGSCKDVKSNEVVDDLDKCNLGYKQQACEAIDKLDCKDLIEKAKGGVKKAQEKNDCVEDAKNAAAARFEKCNVETKYFHDTGKKICKGKRDEMCDNLKTSFSFPDDVHGNLKKCVAALTDRGCV